MPGSSRWPSLGPRGEGYVILQALLVAATAFAFVLDGRFGPVGIGIGTALLAVGLVLFAVSVATLGRSLTPLPRPKDAGELVEHGIYARVRHPIYGALLLAALGWSIAFAPWGIVTTVLLAVLFDLKSRREEAWLLERYPGYAEYRRRTPGRFLPRWPPRAG